MLEVVVRKLAGLVYTSNESASDAHSVSVLGDALARELAMAADRSFFAVGGGVAPVGLAGVSGIGTIDADPSAGLDSYAQAIGQLESSGATATAIFMNPATWTELLVLKEAETSARPLLSNVASGPSGAPQRSLHGVEVRTSAGCPEGVAYAVDGSRVAVVVRADGDVQADRSVKFTSDVTAIRATMRLAWAVPYSESVVAIQAA